jgi:hypothetical protein
MQSRKGTYFRATHLNPQQLAAAFRVGVWWRVDPDAWESNPKDEFDIHSFQTAPALVDFLRRWGEWLRRVEWIEEVWVEETR